MAKVTGIGGVFFKSTSDHKALGEWYSRNLGIQLEPWGGAILKWTEDKSDDGGLTVWNAAAKDTKWFSPSTASFMINYRIDNMTEMLSQLQRSTRAPSRTRTASSPGSSIPTATRLNCGSRWRGTTPTRRNSDSR